MDGTGTWLAPEETFKKSWGTLMSALLRSSFFFSEYYLSYVSSEETGLITGLLFRVPAASTMTLWDPWRRRSTVSGPKFFLRLFPHFRLKRCVSQVFHGNKNSFRARFTKEMRENCICITLSVMTLSCTISSYSFLPNVTIVEMFA